MYPEIFQQKWWNSRGLRTKKRPLGMIMTNFFLTEGVLRPLSPKHTPRASGLLALKYKLISMSLCHLVNFSRFKSSSLQGEEGGRKLEGRREGWDGVGLDHFIKARWQFQMTSVWRWKTETNNILVRVWQEDKHMAYLWSWWLFQCSEHPAQHQS